jgi:hypothetical protein
MTVFPNDITLEGGKYRIIYTKTMSCYVYRNGELWLRKMDQLRGDNFALALVQEIHRLRFEAPAQVTFGLGDRIKAVRTPMPSDD